MIFGFFKQEPPAISEELKRIRMRNDARFKAVREEMESEGKHLNCPSFKWIPSDKWAAEKGIF